MHAFKKYFLSTCYVLGAGCWPPSLRLQVAYSSYLLIRDFDFHSFSYLRSSVAQ